MKPGEGRLCATCEAQVIVADRFHGSRVSCTLGKGLGCANDSWLGIKVELARA